MIYMKKLITVCLLSLWITNMYAQVKQNPKKDSTMTKAETSKYYKDKAKQQNIMGSVLVAGGITVVTVSLANSTNYTALIAGEILGALSIVGGIALFIAGSKSKGKAKILLQNNAVPMSFEPGKNIPINSVGIGIRIGRK